MSAPSILRVEPSAYLPIEAMDQLVNGLRDFCQRIESSDALGLMLHLTPESSTRSAQLTAEADTCGKSESRASRRLTFRFSHEPPAPDARRVGFIFNPIYPTDELLVEMPELLGMTIDQRMELAGRLQILRQLHPIGLFSKKPVWQSCLALWDRVAGRAGISGMPGTVTATFGIFACDSMKRSGWLRSEVARPLSSVHKPAL